MQTLLIFNDFQLFRSEIGRICKQMIEAPDLRCIFYVQRNLQANPLRQLEYVIELTEASKLVTNIDELREGGYATPVSPNFPTIEPKIDSTVEER